MRIYRLFEGKRWPPHINRDGKFVLGDPASGNIKHHKTEKVFVDTEDEVIAKLKLGYSLWVRSKSSPVLVRENLFVDGVRLT
jgi:hypothetical protein